MNKKNKTRKKRILFTKGLSLVEVLVSLLALSFGVIAVSMLMVGNFKNSQDTRNQIIAAQLTQEGTELVRNLKDSGALDGAVYRNSSCPPSHCQDQRIDYTMASLSNGGKQLYLRNNFYEHQSGGGTPTKFFRKIDLEITGNSAVSPSTREIKVHVYTTWNDAGFVGSLANVNSAKCTIINKCVSVVSVLPDLE